jgi:hypothetical protein
MRVQNLRFFVTVLFVSVPAATVSFAQRAPETEVNRTFHLDHIATPTGLQELATVLRTVADIRHLSLETPGASLSLSGTAAELEPAEWLIRELDRPAVMAASEQQIRDTAVHEYRAPGNKDELYRVFYLTNTPTVQGVQEMLTVLRTVAHVQKIFNMTAQHALALRGSTREMGGIAWLIGELDQPAAAATTGTHEFRDAGGDDNVMRVFYPAHHRTPKSLQETLGALRTAIPTQRVYVDTGRVDAGRGAVILGGTAAQVEQATRLIEERDQALASR